MVAYDIVKNSSDYKWIFQRKGVISDWLCYIGFKFCSYRILVKSYIGASLYVT